MIHVVTVLGPNPAPLTELLWYLVRKESRRVGSVRVAVESARTEEYIDKELLGGDAAYLELRSLLGDAIPAEPVFYRPEHLPEHETSPEVADTAPETYWRAARATLEAAGNDPVVFGLTGGRRRVSSAAATAVYQFLARPGDRLVDVRVSQRAAEGGSGFFFPDQRAQELHGRFRYEEVHFLAKDVRIDLDEVELPLLGAFLPEAPPATFAAARTLSERALAAARPPRVRVDVAAMTLEVDGQPITLAPSAWSPKWSTPWGGAPSGSRARSSRRCCTARPITRLEVLMAVYYPNPYRDPIYRGAVVRTWEETYGPLQTDKFATVWDEDEGRFLHLLVSFSANGGDSGDASVDATATIRQRWEALPEAERAVPPRPEPRLSRGWDHRKSFGKIRVHQDRCEDLTVPAALREACTVWQQERAESSLIRAAARVLFDVSHYVRGDWIARDEARARADEASRRRAKVLMRALKPFDAAKLCDRHCLTYAGYAARGIASKGPELDGQILDATEPGKLLKMPLWGFALDASVAEHYGGRFQFRLVGPFLGVPAWHCSGIKGFETEIIGGGVYAVEDRREEGAVTVVTLRQTGAYRPFDVQA